MTTSITPILRQYHWLPVQKRIEYKILTLVFKALHNMAPKYLQELVTVKQSTYSLYVHPLRRCYMFLKLGQPMGVALSFVWLHHFGINFLIMFVTCTA